jgi:hypothetical protein
MTLRKITLTFACLVACGLQWGCTAIAPPAPLAPEAVQTKPQEPDALSAQYARLNATGGRVMRIQPEASQIRIYVFRGGGAF